jgi:hypothetical protein
LASSPQCTLTAPCDRASPALLRTRSAMLLLRSSDVDGRSVARDDARMVAITAALETAKSVAILPCGASSHPRPKWFVKDGLVSRMTESATWILGRRERSRTKTRRRDGIRPPSTTRLDRTRDRTSARRSASFQHQLSALLTESTLFAFPYRSVPITPQKRTSEVRVRIGHPNRSCEPPSPFPRRATGSRR